MSLSEDLHRIAAAAEGFADPGEQLSGLLPAEPRTGERVYLCAFDGDEECRRWLAFDADGRPVESRSALRDAVSILALCELAEETAAGGDLDELRARLVSLRLTQGAPGIEQAEEAVLDLQRTIGAPPRVASPGRLDDLGSATRRVEQALGEGGSPFAQAMKVASLSIESLTEDVEANYKLALR